MSTFDDYRSLRLLKDIPVGTQAHRRFVWALRRAKAAESKHDWDVQRYNAAADRVVLAILGGWKP